MPSRSRKVPKPGRPRGSRSFDADVAEAFGAVVKEARLKAGVSQEELAHLAQLERSYFGRVERGRSQPTLFALLKIAGALGYKGAKLVMLVERTLEGSSTGA